MCNLPDKRCSYLLSGFHSVVGSTSSNIMSHILVSLTKNNNCAIDLKIITGNYLFGWVEITPDFFKLSREVAGL